MISRLASFNISRMKPICSEMQENVLRGCKFALANCSRQWSHMVFWRIGAPYCSAMLDLLRVFSANYKKPCCSLARPSGKFFDLADHLAQALKTGFNPPEAPLQACYGSILTGDVAVSGFNRVSAADPSISRRVVVTECYCDFCVMPICALEMLWNFLSIK